jgi:hypothetical protein
MSWGDRNLQGNEDAVALKLPVPQSFHTGPLNVTVQEDDFRMAILGPEPVGRVARMGARQQPLVACDKLTPMLDEPGETPGCAIMVGYTGCAFSDARIAYLEVRALI